MNLVTFGLILICCHVWAIETNVVSEYELSKFQNFLIRCQEILKTGNDTLGIPILDPISEQQLNINIKEQLLILSALSENFVVYDLSNYNVNSNSNFRDIPPVVTVDLTWPAITVSTNYKNLNGVIDNYPLFGKEGNIKITAKDLTLVVTINFDFTETVKYIKVRETNLKLSLGKLNFRASGLFEDEDASKLMSVIISEAVPQIIENNQEIPKKLADIVTKLLDEFTSDWTLLDILKMIRLLD